MTITKNTSLYPFHDFVDVNECLDQIDDCDSNATCSNTPGSYACSCNAGYTGDGRTCVGKEYLYVISMFSPISQWRRALCLG